MKTLGKVSANLIATLYDDNRSIFTIEDVVRICKTSHTTATKLIYDMIKRKNIFRIKKGKYIIIPQELGSSETYLGNWFVAAREVANSPNYYVAFYSAMKYWGMTTQPIVKIFVATPKRQFPPQTLIDKISFVYINKRNIWGVSREWVTKTERVNFSDIERTIIDALAHPEYCGGITEIAKGIWLIKDKLDFNRILRYARKYNKNVVAKRLGYILEILEIGNAHIAEELKTFIKNRYDLFDPTAEKKFVGRNAWRLIDNIGKEQIRKVISA